MKAEGAALNKMAGFEESQDIADIAGVSLLCSCSSSSPAGSERAGKETPAVNRAQHGFIFDFISSYLCLFSRQRKQTQPRRLLSLIYLNLGQFSRSAPTVT